MRAPPSSLDTARYLAARAATAFDASRWMEIERLRLVHANLPVTLVVSVASAAILALTLRGVVSQLQLVLWFCVGAAVSFLRYVHYRQLKRLADDALDIGHWRRRVEVGAALSGAFWGFAGGVLFPPDDLPHQLFIGFVLAGLSAGAMTSYSAIRRCYFLFVLPAILPIVVRMLFEDGDIQRSMAVLTLLFLGVVVRAASETDRMIGNVLKVRAENVELTQALHHEATHDALVDLVNHREFNQRLKAVAKAAARNREPYALLFVDLDHFKEINDTGGHAAGDETLRRVGRILKAQIRATDTAARMGGDEFAILLPHCPRARAEEVARSILAAIEDFALHWEGGKFFRVGASIGVAYTDAGEHDASAVLRAADSACYAAKNNGRGRIEVYHADPMYEASGRFQLMELRKE
jgi:diguanylate cyclase (GGDEF)-like protein